MAAIRIEHSICQVVPRLRKSPVATLHCAPRASRSNYAATSIRGYARTTERPRPTSRTCILNTRTFSSSASRLKKGGKAVKEQKRESAKEPEQDDPYDLTELKGDIAKIAERLKNDLSKLRSGGRFNPEVVENLRVQAEKGSSQTVRLSDLAQCIPKGRQLHVMVGDKEHLKPVSAAISSSTLSLTPQPDPTGANPLLLVINIPPPTGESRKAAVDEASKAGEKALTSIRDARGKQQKKLRAMQLAKSARPDDLKKAGTQMEKAVEVGSADVKKVVDQAKKVLESN